MQRILWLRVFALLLLMFCVLPARACLWDNDTLESEAKGIPDTIAVITGRFARNPDLYYEMRLARVEKEIGSTPAKLELYDDAAVACDRLHRGDEAIAWMNRKTAQMQKMRGAANAEVLREHRYRYLANLGTFIAHRWLRNGADRKKISEMKRARNLIAAAIQLNPNAHFGREKYQLKAMDWIIHPPQVKDGVLPDFLGLYKYNFGELDEGMPAKINYSEPVKGLSGLIALGDAWESVDMFNALSKALKLDDQKSSPAYMALLRACELADNGRQSILPNAPKGKSLKSLLMNEAPLFAIQREKIPVLGKYFMELRKEADNWQAQRTAYMMERLEAGRHPDTDKNFWDDWKEPPAPSLHIPSPDDEFHKTLGSISIAAGIFFAFWIAWIIVRIVKRKTAGD